jgi:hypothetical protein
MSCQEASRFGVALNVLLSCLACCAHTAWQMCVGQADSADWRRRS